MKIELQEGRNKPQIGSECLCCCWLCFGRDLRREKGRANVREKCEGKLCSNVVYFRRSR